MQHARPPYPILLLLIGLAVVAPGAAWAVPGPAAQPVGAWTLKLDDGSRQCRITLRAEAQGTGHALAMPAGCRHAFPTLAAVTTWVEAGDNQLLLESAAGEPVVSFEAGTGGALTGAGPQGNLFRLEPVGDHKPVGTAAALKTKGDAAPAQAPAPRATASAKPAEIAGHYAVLREKSGDTGCMVTLDDKAHGPKGTLKANLAPACRDQGIVIFDPVGWDLKGGRLVLVARKGHTTELDLQEDGTWLKDPKQGKAMRLKRI